EGEVARADSRVYHRHRGQRKHLQRLAKRAVEDELLHEHRCLQKRVLLPCSLAQILIEVAEETRVPCWISEVVRKRTRGRVHAPPELHERLGRVRRRVPPKHRIVALVEERTPAWQCCQSSEDLQEPVS